MITETLLTFGDLAVGETFVVNDWYATPRLNTAGTLVKLEECTMGERHMGARAWVKGEPRRFWVLACYRVKRVEK